MRLQTDKSYEKVGIVKRPAEQPRSYIVEAGGKDYRRNRRHLLFVPEPVPVQSTSAHQQPPAASKRDVPSFSTVGSPSPHQSPSKTPVKFTVPQEAPLRTLSRSQTPIKSFLSSTTESDVGNGNLFHPDAHKSQVVTRSGRISRPNPRYQDFVT